MSVSVVITAMGAQKHWDFIASNFKPDVTYVYGMRDMNCHALKMATEISSPLDLPTDHEIVLLAPPNGTNIQGVTNLLNFVHPTNAIYWFGSDANHLESEVFTDRPPDHYIYIPTDSIDQMYAAAAYGVVAWDRRLKAL